MDVDIRLKQREEALLDCVFCVLQDDALRDAVECESLEMAETVYNSLLDTLIGLCSDVATRSITRRTARRCYLTLYEIQTLYISQEQYSDALTKVNRALRRFSHALPNAENV